MHLSTTTRRSRQARRVTALLLTAGLLASACGSDSSDEADGSSGGGDSPGQPASSAEGVQLRNLDGDLEGTPVDGGSLVVGMEADSEGFNPVTSPWALSGHYVASAIFDPLVTFDAEGDTVPYLAESVESNEDFTKWTIKVRSGVEFHNGEPLTSAEVKGGLDAMRDSVVVSDALALVDDVSIVDDLTVEVSMSEPWAMFPTALTSQVGYVVPKALTEDLATLAHPIGTGPFVFESWDQESEVVVRKNENYWQEGKPHLDQITFRAIGDHTTRLSELRSGAVDVIHTATPADVRIMRDDPNLKVVESSNGEKEFIMLNTSVEPFDRIEARRAAAMAIDVERYLLETGHEGVSLPATGIFSPGQLGYSEDNGYVGYDLEGAKAEAAAYEAATGKPLAFTLSGHDSVEQAQIQQSLVAMWKEAGIDVTVRATDQSGVILNSAVGDFQAMEFRNFGSIDPDADMFFLLSGDLESTVSLNFPRFFDEEVDSAVLLGRSTTVEATRQEAYAGMAARLNSQLPYIWLFRVNWALAADPRVRGISAGANGSLQTLGAKTWIADLWIG